MNFYFVSIYNPKGEKRECFGLFELEQYNNEYYLKWMFGHKVSQLKEFCQLVAKEANQLYIIDTLVGEPYTYGYPFKPHYFNCVVSKEELREHLLCGQV